MGRRRRRRKAALVIMLLLILVLFWGSVLLADRMLRPVLLSMARIRVEGMGTTVVTRVLQEEAIKQISYGDLIEVETTSEGYVSYMMPQTGRIMETVGRVGERVQQELDSMTQEPMSIPMGQLTGIALLANIGPKVPVEIRPMGAAKVEVEEEFAGVGINHARHTIFMSIKCDMIIAAPLIQNDLHFSVSLPVAEAIIVGPVPDMYLPLGMLPGYPGVDLDKDYHGGGD